MKDKPVAKHALDTQGIKKDLILITIFAVTSLVVITSFRVANIDAQTFTSLATKLGQLL